MSSVPACDRWYPAVLRLIKLWSFQVMPGETQQYHKTLYRATNPQCNLTWWYRIVSCTKIEYINMLPVKFQSIFFTRQTRYFLFDLQGEIIIGKKRNKRSKRGRGRMSFLSRHFLPPSLNFVFMCPLHVHSISFKSWVCRIQHQTKEPNLSDALKGLVRMTHSKL